MNAVAGDEDLRIRGQGFRRGRDLVREGGEDLGQPSLGVLGKAEFCNALRADLLPCRRRNQEVFEVSVPPASDRPDLGRLEPAMEFQHRADLIIVAVDLPVAADDVRAPALGCEADRRRRGHLSNPLGVPVAEGSDRMEDRLRGLHGLELDHA
jgi:hypothetical protein